MSLFLVVGCVSRKHPIPLASMHNFEVSEKPSTNGLELAITGVYFNGFGAIGRTQTSRTDKSILVEVFPRTPSRYTSGELLLKLATPPGVDTVDFGELGKTIWRRDKGPMPKGRQWWLQ